ncbi:MAG TPA: hypothetical protein VHY20_12430, partial [Pirellulales bacterium]|nr:hypothetical protein [Pirellulales bacterium]
MISRRDLILRIPAAAALSGAWATGSRAGASDQQARNPVACQMNAWQIKPGDFSELLARVADLKGLGFEAFECNVRFVEGQFAQAEKARARITETGVRFYGPHTSLRFKLDELKRYADGAAALGAGRIVLS